MSSVFICQERSLFIELLIFCYFGDKKKIIVLTHLRILCIALEKVLFSIQKYIDIFLIICCRHSLKVPHRGAPN